MKLGIFDTILNNIVKTDFFKILSFSFIGGILMGVSMFEADNRIPLILFIIVIFILSLLSYINIKEYNDNDDIKKDKYDFFYKTILTYLLVILISEIFVFQTFLLDFKTVNTNVVVTKQNSRIVDILEEDIKNKTDVEKLSINIKTLNDKVNILLKDRNTNIDSKVTLYTIEIFNSENNSVINTYKNLDIERVNFYKNIKSVKYYHSYIPFVKFDSSFKYIYKDIVNEQ